MYMYMVFFVQFDDGKITNWKLEFRGNINDPYKIYMHLNKIKSD